MNRIIFRPFPPDDATHERDLVYVETDSVGRRNGPSHPEFAFYPADRDVGDKISAFLLEPQRFKLVIDSLMDFGERRIIGETYKNDPRAAQDRKSSETLYLHWNRGVIIDYAAQNRRYLFCLRILDATQKFERNVKFLPFLPLNAFTAGPYCLDVFIYAGLYLPGE